jgi:hypothetical protein
MFGGKGVRRSLGKKCFWLGYEHHKGISYPREVIGECTWVRKIDKGGAGEFNAWIIWINFFTPQIDQLAYMSSWDKNKYFICMFFWTT